MSDSTPYVRPALTATRMGACDPGLLVDLWLDRLMELDDAAGEVRPEQAYDLLALRGRLWRCRPELVEATGRAAAREQAQTRSAGLVPELMAAAAGLPDPDGWLREAAALADACDDGGDESTLAARAEQLLTDLDDADLVARAVNSAGIGSPELEEGLARCHAWLADNPDRFFPAAVFIQALGQAIRPDLPAFDIGLAATADKFVLLLDALEDAEGVFVPRGRPGSRIVPSPAPPAWPVLRRPELALAAAAPVATGLTRRRWVSPDGAYRAVLVVDPAADAAPRLNLYRGGEPAADLAGQVAALAGCLARVDAGGNADFSVAELRLAWSEGRPFRLRVGRWPEEWQAVGGDG